MFTFRFVFVDKKKTNLVLKYDNQFSVLLKAKQNKVIHSTSVYKSWGPNTETRIK